MLREIESTAAEYPGMSEDPGFKAALAAIATIDRRLFVPPDQRRFAYRNSPLPIGYDQTISDPYIVAVMTAAVGARSGSNVLEIGTGSGYQAAVLSLVGATVHSVEIVEPLAKRAQKLLGRLRLKNVSIKAGDGFAGLPEYGLYDAVIVTAGSSKVPEPLIDQLKTGGKLVMPIGPNVPFEQLIVFTKHADGMITRCSLGPAMFVPLTGRGLHVDRPGLYDREVKLCYHGQTNGFTGQSNG